MSKERGFNFLTLVLVSIIVVIVSSSRWGLIKPIKIGNPLEQTYNNAIAGFSFEYPSALRVMEKIGVGNIGFVDISPVRSTEIVSPYFIEVSFQPSLAGKSLGDQAINYLPEIKKENLTPLARSDIEGLQYISSRGVERSIYNFFVANNQFVTFKFNQRYFEKTNPLVLIDNTSYYSVYLNILSSLKFGRT